MRSPTSIILASLLAAVPFGFGVIRLVTTGTDVRYLWMAAAALAGAFAAGALGGSRTEAVGAGRTAGVVITAMLCTAVAALLLGGRASSGVAIMSIAFGSFAGASWRVAAA